MQIRLTPDQESRLAAAAARTGRSTAEVVQEALTLWEEREEALAEFRVSLDEAELSLARGEGIEITTESMQRLTDEIIERTAPASGKKPTQAR